jgi:hydrogenase 3 maturation protease
LTKKKYDIKKELAKWLKGAERVVIVGIGNPIRMDDYVGVKIVQNLRGKVSDKVMLIEAETVPENYMHEIVGFQPTHVLLIDAAIQGLKPGETRLAKTSELKSSPVFSTHMLPLRLFCEQLSETAETKICFLLIEPKTTDFGEGMTPEIDNLAQRATKILVTILQLSLL